MLKILKENNEIENIELDNENSNEVNDNEEIETEELDKELQDELMVKACGDAVNNLVNICWDLISQINSVIATLDFDYKKDNKESIKDILNSIIDDATVNVGMLHKAISIIDEKKSDLIADGESKAEDIINK